MQALFVVIWMLCGAGIAMAMVRRGHSPFLWWILIPCGPLLGLLALNAKDAEVDVTEIVVREGARGPGRLDVLVGVDGHRAAVHACRAIVGELGDALGRVTLATVLDYDVGQVEDRAVRVQAARLWLEEAAEAVVEAGGPEPRACVLIGKPAAQLVEFARAHARDLIVVANRSHAAARHAVAGSVAHSVMLSAPCPVLLIPHDSHDAAEAA